MKNPITTIKNYGKNVNKELTDIFGNQQRTGSGEIAKKAKGNALIVKLPGGKVVKNGPSEKKANKILSKDRSELFGAILQGRRYDAGVKTTTATVNKVFRPSSNK
jgi:hypothetical protein